MGGDPPGLLWKPDPEFAVRQRLVVLDDVGPEEAGLIAKFAADNVAVLLTGRSALGLLAPPTGTSFRCPTPYAIISARPWAPHSRSVRISRRLRCSATVPG
ncbi:hypothetical protein [Streptosporangium sp. KLBMP 9127]|nr:hypothetical protein [Streptosporangium sp. KLBMP 9127]